MPNFSGIWTVTQQMQAKGASTWPAVPGAPTIGTATAGSSLCASVTFTAPACTGYPSGGITGYRVISTPGCFTQTGASSPLVVTGLASGTSYTFKAQATNSIGYGALSAASNSITATNASSQSYITAGTYSWVAPSGVTKVSVVVVGHGGGGGAGRQTCIGYYSGGGGGGGGLAYGNNITVIPGNSYSVFVASGGNSRNYFSSCSFLYANSGVFNSGPGGTTGGTALTAGYSGGMAGQAGFTPCGIFGGGGGGAAGGYSSDGGAGGSSLYCVNGVSGTSGSPGGGGGGSTTQALGGGGGGGIGLLGAGSSGAGGQGNGGSYFTAGLGGGGGSGGSNGSPKNFSTGGNGGAYGGGAGGGAAGSSVGGTGAGGAVRIIWPGCSRSFPSTCAGSP